MASDLLSIAASGARAARAALDVTAQNIANASSDGYVRRSVRMEEVSASGGQLRIGDISLSGARVSGIHRNADLFRQAEVRRTGSDLARADAELGGLENIESAIEQSGLYDSIVEFEAALQQLASDPTNSSLRSAVLAGADTLANKFNIAVDSLGAAGEGLRFNASAATEQANVLGQELARVNLRLSRAGEGSSDRATLLDQRDSLLEQMSGIVDITTSFASDGAVTVTTGGATLVSGGDFAELSMGTAADGTISFAVGGTAVQPTGGALAGAALALESAAQVRGRLDALADGIASAVNAAQASGVGLDGTAGQPIFAGTGAGGIKVVMTDSGGIATAPAGAPAGSNDGSNLAALRQALESGGVAGSANALLFDVSSAVAGKTVTRDALDAIASSARISLEQQAGVDLDTEAANLMRFQQAFQASGRAMQVASDIFQSLLQLR
ncbi:flagellar hook-associated protein FlgK [Altererythrobacter sp. C41]|uniref:flagellar hook-associated protein FlgK n=1 Tax=Altererythrobacter sp. C41 TaxID=2806021 RepID=UPI001933A3EE|nr:flagellar hook-associated protein FlgK [Altererythrobacter sp. C41]MBM0171162.1 flagellar hook-associated protein FlgK [Altererythrobacter sp. C41]